MGDRVAPRRARRGRRDAAAMTEGGSRMEDPWVREELQTILDCLRAAPAAYEHGACQARLVRLLLEEPSERGPDVPA